MILNQKPVILAIDDDPFIINLLVSLLIKEYSVRPFTSGRMALDFLSEHTADLILLDYRMPDMMGFEVLKALREDPNSCEIPVIFLTGSNDSENEADALEHGASDYIMSAFAAYPCAAATGAAAASQESGVTGRGKDEELSQGV